MSFFSQVFDFPLKTGGAGAQTETLYDADHEPKAFVFANPFKKYVGGLGGPAHHFAVGLDDGHGHAGGYAAGGGVFLSGDNTVQTASDTHSIECVQNIAILINALRARGKVTAVAPGSFILTTDVLGGDGEGVGINALALGGDELDATVKFFNPDTVGEHVVNGWGFDPKVLIAICNPLARGTDVRSAGAYASVGWSVKCEGKGACVASSDTGGGTTNAVSYQRQSRLIALVHPGGAGSVLMECAVSAWGADSVTINVLTSSAGVYLTLLALGGNVAGNVGRFTQGDASFAFPALDPRAILVTSNGRIAGESVVRDGQILLGMWAPPKLPQPVTPSKFNQIYSWIAVKDAKTPSGWCSKSRGQTDPIVVGTPNGSGTTVQAAGIFGDVIGGLAPLIWTVDDGGDIVFDYLVVAYDPTGADPCGASGFDDLLLAACPTGSGVVGAPYHGVVVASGGTAPYTFAITSGALPAGLTLDAATGEITGTPTESGTFVITFEVTDDDAATAEGECTIAIAAAGAVDCLQPPGASTAGLTGEAEA